MAREFERINAPPRRATSMLVTTHSISIAGGPVLALGNDPDRVSLMVAATSGGGTLIGFGPSPPGPEGSEGGWYSVFGAEVYAFQHSGIVWLMNRSGSSTVTLLHGYDKRKG